MLDGKRRGVLKPHLLVKLSDELLGFGIDHFISSEGIELCHSRVHKGWLQKRIGSWYHLRGRKAWERHPSR